jgi:hypothetical protein
MQRRPIHRPLLGLAGSGSASLAGSCCQSWNGFNGVPGVRSLLYMGSTTQSLLAVGARRHHSACYRRWTGGADVKAESQCGAVLGCAPARSAETELALLCRLALCSPKKIQKAMDGAWCYEWRAAVRSGRDGEEGRAGGDVHWEQTMHRVCRAMT